MVTKHPGIRVSHGLDQSLKALDLLGRRTIQIVAIKVDSTVGTKTPTRTFDIRDPALILWVMEHNQSHNMYFTLNEAANSSSKKPAESEITRIHGIGFDCDPTKKAPLASEQQRLIRLGRDMLLNSKYPPTFVIKTGNGIQGVFLFEEPLNDFEPDHIRSIGKRLQSALGADRTANLDRLYRLPGTVNHPTQGKQKRGYKQTQSGIMMPPKGVKPRKYALEEL